MRYHNILSLSLQACRADHMGETKLGELNYLFRLRYFSCPPQTGLFVQAAKVTSLDDATAGSRSPSPPRQQQKTPTAGSRAARYIGMTASQLTQRQAAAPQQNIDPAAAANKRSSSVSVRTSGLRRPPSHIQSPTPTRRRASGNQDGLPSPAVTPTSNSLHDPDTDEFYANEELLNGQDMLTDTPAPANMALSKSTEPASVENENSHARLERILGEAISQAPDEAVMRIQQLQVRIEVLEAENKFLKLENAQNKTAEQILERSMVLRKKNGQDDDTDNYFTLEGHKAIVEEIKQEHEQARKTWDQESDQLKSTIKKLENRVKELEEEQAELIKERDELQNQVSEMRKEKTQMEHKVHELEEKVAIAEANAAAAQASRAAVTSNFYSQDPDEMHERQMQMEMEMEEVHEKMASLMEAMRAKDMFLGTLSEQVEMHRNMVEEREREVRRIKADADRHSREKDRLREEIKELEDKWLQHQDCASREEFDKIKRELSQARDNLTRENAAVEEYKKRVESLEQSVDELKRAGMESIELYESSVELHRIDMEAINASLMDERRKVAALEAERESLRKAGLEAIETYEATIDELKKEHSNMTMEETRERSEMQATIDKLKQEIEQLVNARDKTDEVEKIKSVWENERNRLLENIEASTASLNKERELCEQLKAESVTLREQLKESDKVIKEKQALQEQVQRLQSDYEELLNSRTKYLDDVRSAVESQKKTEGELRRLTEAKDKTERELATAQESLKKAEATLAEMRKSGSDTELLSMERAKHAKDLDMLRQEIEKLEAQNAMLSKQKEQAELAAKAGSANVDGAEYKRQVDSLKEENKKLLESNKELSQSQKQLESECIKLMDEVEKLHSEGLHFTENEVTNDEECANDEERVKKLQIELAEMRRQMERISLKHAAEIRQLKEKHSEQERAHERQVASMNRDISELEGLIESKIFKEADLEEALEKERKLSRKLREELADLKDQQKHQLSSSKTSSTSTSSPRTDDAPYCELCEVAGHDIISCKAVSTDRPVSCQAY